MTFRPSNTLEIALDENISFAEDWKEFLEQFTGVEHDLARKINGKERGLYPEAQEILNSQRFFALGNPRSFRSVFRKVFPFGTIAPGAPLVILHGITEVTEFTRMYGTIITNTPDNRPLPYVDTINITNQVSLLRNGINIVITNGVTAPAIVSGICVVEYVKS